MENQKPPVRIIVPGKCYRVDYDVSHTPMFHQVEGLLVDRHATFSELKGILTSFARQMFGDQTQMRFRPHFFPFTEPSAEVDISCTVCQGKGCRSCGNTGWIEILGAGAVDPAVFEAVTMTRMRLQGLLSAWAWNGLRISCSVFPISVPFMRTTCVSYASFNFLTIKSGCCSTSFHESTV